ncbi:MAG: PilZ domain-containing protein [Candidatus Aminicenantales bacterium]
MKKASSANKNSKKKASKKKSLPLPVEVNRRKEWRFDLPLSALVKGKLPQGKKFQEISKLKNISSGGAYFCLDSGVIVGSKLNLIIDIPKELTEGKKLKLQLGGITVRLEKPDRKGKRQGVALRFSKEFKFIPR